MIMLVNSKKYGKVYIQLDSYNKQEFLEVLKDLGDYTVLKYTRKELILND